MFKRTIRAWSTFAPLAVVVSLNTAALPRTAHAVEVSCDDVVELDENFTLNADYVKEDNNDPCFLVTGSNVTVNLNNHQVICRKSGGCLGGAFRVNGSDVTVKNGKLVSDGGDWNIAINCTSFTHNFPCTVQDVFIENASVSAIRCAKRVESSVIIDSVKCIESFVTLPNGSSSNRYWQNFCDGVDVGIEAIGPGSGTPFIIERNVMRTTATGGVGIDAQSGRFTVEKNVMIADEPIDDTSATVTLTKNICDVPGDCPLPTGEPFTFNLDFP